MNLRNESTAQKAVSVNFYVMLSKSLSISSLSPSPDENAVALAKELQQTENLFVGISSGANLAGAIELAKRKENAGKTIVLVLPDSGDRYLSILK